TRCSEALQVPAEAGEALRFPQVRDQHRASFPQENSTHRGPYVRLLSGNASRRARRAIAQTLNGQSRHRKTPHAPRGTTNGHSDMGAAHETVRGPRTLR